MAVCGTSDCKNIFIKHIKSYEIGCSNLEKEKIRRKNLSPIEFLLGLFFLIAWCACACDKFMCGHDRQKIRGGLEGRKENIWPKKTSGARCISL